LFLSDVRAAFIVASAIPLSMMFAFIGMEWAGLSANLMSLGAIDFGMIVDGAVVMVENFVRKLTHKEPSLTTTEVIDGAAKELGRPLLFGILILIAVHVPILTLQGIEGKMFIPLALTRSFALIGSLLLTLTFVPVVSSFLLKEQQSHQEPKLIHWIRRFYTPLLEKALNHRLITFAIALGILMISFGLVPFLGTEFIPELDEGSILVQPIRMPSISLTESIEMEKKIQQIIMQFPEVEFVVGRLGRPDIATDPMGVNLSDIYVTLKPKSEWKTASTKDELVQKMVEELNHVPGVNYNITQPIAMRVDELVSGVKSDIAVKLFGSDLKLLKQKADQIAEVVRSVEGAADVLVEQTAGQTYLNIYIDRNAIARYGLNIADVQRIVDLLTISKPRAPETSVRQEISLPSEDAVGVGKMRMKPWQWLVIGVMIVLWLVIIIFGTLWLLST